jgi:hypothetical protein
MHCKKCDAVFHMDRSGKIVLGDPNDAGRKKSGGGGGGGTATKPAKAKARPKKSSEPAGEGLGGMISALPGPVKAGILGACLLVILGVTLGPSLRKMLVGTKVPKGLDARTNFVGEAFAYSDLGGILKVAQPGTEDSLRQWYDKVRPMFKFSGPKQQGNIVIPQPLAETNSGGEARIAIRLTAPNSASVPEVAEAKTAYEKNPKPLMLAGYNPDGTFDLPTVWALTNDNAFLDGAKSLDLLNNPPKADDGKKKK